jgi:HSP20 family protein
MAETRKQEQHGKQPQHGNGGSNTAAQSRKPMRHGAMMPFNRLRDEFNRMFDQFFGGWPAFWEGGQRQHHWGLDMDEDEKSVTVRAEAPGFEPQDFDIQVRGDQLVMCACKKAESQEKEHGFHQWQQHDFFESVTLPTAIDPSKVEAQYKNGILTVTMPKTEDSKGRRIEVKG